MAAAKDLPVLGVAELGYMLDVTRARVSQMVQQPDFPDGIELRMGKVWWAEDITAWAAAKDAPSQYPRHLARRPRRRSQRARR